jgi:single-strand selective monofunctional uracil DNA glycosylase
VPVGPPVAHVYDPLVYAREPFERYLARAASGPREVLLLGMNPGPYGMAQTGVPFGAVPLVRDWLGITGAVGRPPSEHPRRPVLGFDCPRCEVSDERLWGWARDTFGDPDAFLSRFAVINYCPLLFLDDAGRNLTPAQLSAATRRAVEEPCDATLREVLAFLRPRVAVGVGRYAEDKLRRVAPAGVTVGGILHPSPASPAANRGWAQSVAESLGALGVDLPAG